MRIQALNNEKGDHMGRKAIDFTNKKIGYVTIIKRSENQDPYKRALWIGQCDCGRIFEVSSAVLKNTNENFSCGCKRSKSPNAGKKAEDFSGQKIGWLTVINRNYTYAKDNNLKQGTFWNCICDCGNTKVIRSSVLKNGKLQNCGCLQGIQEDLTGKQFGKLTVIGPDFKLNIQNKINKIPGIFWKCNCDCGSQISVTTNYLKRTKNPHCNNCNILIEEDITGQIFNYLTVIQKDYEYNKINNVQGSYWKCKCICGNETSVRKDCLKKGIIKSCGCMKKQLSLESNMIDMKGKKFGQITILEPDFEYVKKHDIKNSGHVIYWKYQCDCGKIHSAPGTDIRSGKVNCCPDCSISRGENKIKTLLDENNINYIYNKPYFIDLINPTTNKILRYDFIILDNNNSPKYLIEYDGEQHFFSVDYFGGEERFKKQQYYDNLKNEYSKQHNLPLIRIPYTQFKNLKYEDLDILTSNFIYN